MSDQDSERRSPEPCRILVVDDNPANLKLMSVVLRSKGFTVTGAKDAREAFAALAAGRPDAILLDLQLPGVDGFEIARRIRSESNTSSIPIIAVTAFAMRGDEERARAAGCDEYVTKPIDTRKLPELVAALASRDRASESGG